MMEIFIAISYNFLYNRIQFQINKEKPLYYFCLSSQIYKLFCLSQNNFVGLFSLYELLVRRNLTFYCKITSSNRNSQPFVDDAVLYCSAATARC